jgi:hypothetical protein
MKLEYCHRSQILKYGMCHLISKFTKNFQFQKPFQSSKFQLLILTLQLVKFDFLTREIQEHQFITLTSYQKFPNYLKESHNGLFFL